MTGEPYRTRGVGCRDEVATALWRGGVGEGCSNSEASLSEEVPESESGSGRSGAGGISSRPRIGGKEAKGIGLEAGGDGRDEEGGISPVVSRSAGMSGKNEAFRGQVKLQILVCTAYLVCLCWWMTPGYPEDMTIQGQTGSSFPQTLLLLF